MPFRPIRTPMADLVPAALDSSRARSVQMRMLEQPGCVIAVAHRARIVLETRSAAPICGPSRADAASSLPRRANSKTFTAAGIMKLRERGAQASTTPSASTCTGARRGGGSDARAAPLAQLGRGARRGDGRSWPAAARSPTKRARRGAVGPADDRGEHPVQIFQQRYGLSVV